MPSSNRAGAAETGARAFEHGDSAAASSRPALRAPGLKPIGNPERLKRIPARSAQSQRLRDRRPGLRRKTPADGSPVLGALKRQVSAGRSLSDHSPVRAARGLGQGRSIRSIRAANRAPRPSWHQHDQQGPVAGDASLRVQNRPGKPDDHRRNRKHPQQQQPPRRAVGLAFVVLQPQQQRHPGNRRRIGAGGTARSNIHRIGKADQAKQQPRRGKCLWGRGVHISRVKGSMRKAKAAPIARLCRCDGMELPAGVRARSARRLCGRQAGRDTGPADRPPSAFRALERPMLSKMCGPRNGKAFFSAGQDLHNRPCTPRSAAASGRFTAHIAQKIDMKSARNEAASRALGRAIIGDRRPAQRSWQSHQLYLPARGGRPCRSARHVRPRDQQDRAARPASRARLALVGRLVATKSHRRASIHPEHDDCAPAIPFRARNASDGPIAASRCCAPRRRHGRAVLPELIAHARPPRPCSPSKTVVARCSASARSGGRGRPAPRHRTFVRASGLGSCARPPSVSRFGHLSDQPAQVSTARARSEGQRHAVTRTGAPCAPRLADGPAALQQRRARTVSISACAARGPGPQPTLSRTIRARFLSGRQARTRSRIVSTTASPTGIRRSSVCAPSIPRREDLRGLGFIVPVVAIRMSRSVSRSGYGTSICTRNRSSCASGSG